MTEEISLEVEFCGRKLLNPFVLSASPATANAGLIKRAFRLGWGGAVTKTINSAGMKINDVSPRFSIIRDPVGDVVGFQNLELSSPRPLESWIEDIKEIKKEFPERYLAASINAPVIKEEWQNLTKSVQEAGADAVELNFSAPHGLPEQGIGQAIGQDPAIAGKITAWVKEVAKVPVLPKLTPSVADICLVGQAVEANGADAVVAINTINCLMSIDLDTLVPHPDVDGQSTFGGYSGPAIKPIGLRCIAQLANCLEIPLIGVGGITSWKHAAEYILLGASLVEIGTSALLKGQEIISDLIKGLSNYLISRGEVNTLQLRGLSLGKITSYEGLSRVYRVVADVEYASCISCDKCINICQNAGKAAMCLDEDNLPVVDGDLCDGCSLCKQVCDTNCITMKPISNSSCSRAG